MQRLTKIFAWTKDGRLAHTCRKRGSQIDRRMATLIEHFDVLDQWQVPQTVKESTPPLRPVQDGVENAKLLELWQKLG